MAGPVRQEIDLVALSRYFQSHFEQFAVLSDIQQFGYGQSNPTYLLINQNARKCVLRKKPPGKLLSRAAHQVEREYQVIQALEFTDVPVPKTYLYCDDDTVIGTPFYVMEYLEGRIFDDPSLPHIPAQDRCEMWAEAIITLAKLHKIHPKSIGLETYGRAGGFYQRQLKTLTKVSEAQAVATDLDTGQPIGGIPHLASLVEFFGDTRWQPGDRTTLIHGDYKIDNLIFHKTKPEIIGILDWEMSTIGHPLSDLANLLSPYCFANGRDNPALRLYAQPAFHVSQHTPGLPLRNECIATYCKQANWNPVTELAWGDAFAAFRNAVIMQGIAARYAKRQASSARAKEIGSMMIPLGTFTWDLVGAILETKKLTRSSL